MKERIHYQRDQVIAWLSKRFPNINWEPVAQDLPKIIWRCRWDHLAEKHGLPYSRKYMQTLDCKGEGPTNVKQN